MTRAEEYRTVYVKLGLVAEVIIANVIVGNYTWREAYRLSDALIKTWTAPGA